MGLEPIGAVLAASQQQPGLADNEIHIVPLQL